MKNFRKRWTAWVLMFSLIISAVPVNAFAYDGGAVDDQVIEIAQGGFYDLTQDLEAGLTGVWESDNEEIVVVNENGVAEGKAVGETTVRFTAEKINLGPAPEIKDEAVNAPVNSDAAVSGPDAGVIAPDEGDGQPNQEPGAVDTPVADENNSEKTDSELTGTEGTGSEVNGGEEGNTTDTPAAEETGSNNEAVENDGANGGEPAVGDDSSNENNTSDGDDTVGDTSDDASAGDDSTGSEPSAEGTDGAYLTEETDDAVVYTWTVRVYDPAVVAETCKQLDADLTAFGEKFGSWQEEYFAGLTEDSLDEYGDMTVAAKTAFGEAAVAQFGEELNALIALYQQIPASVRNDETSEFNATFATLVNIAEQLGLDLYKATQTLDNAGKVVFSNATQWKEGQENTVDISANQSVTMDVSGTVTGRLVVTGAGTLIITGTGTIDGSKQGSVITVNGPKVVLSGPTITGGMGTRISAGNVPLKPDGKPNQWYEEYTAGGGVLVWKGTFEMNGGSITNNTANKGGGVFVPGGDFYLHTDGNYTDKTDGVSAKLNMTGGNVTYNQTEGTQLIGNNRAGEGGGIWLGSKGNKVSGGAITNNTCNTTADWGGGGIYVNNNADLTVVGAVITNNTAEGLGGGVSGCPHAGIALGVTDGALIYGNTAKKTDTGHPMKDKETFYSSNGNSYNPNFVNNVFANYNYDKTSQSYQYYTGDYLAYDHDKEHFTADKAMDFYCVDSCVVVGQNIHDDADISYIGRLAVGEKNYKFNNGVRPGMQYATDVTIKYGETYSVTTGSLGLTALGTSSRDAGLVLIADNNSTTHGGGIACNGALYLGEMDGNDYSSNTWSIAVKKDLVNPGGTVRDMEAEEFEFELLAVDQNGAPIEPAIATAKNAADGTVRFVVDDDNYAGTKTDRETTGNKEANNKTEITYKFVVREKSGQNNSDVNYDTTPKEIEVKIIRVTSNTVIGKVTPVNVTTTNVFATLTKGFAPNNTITNTMKPGSLTVQKVVSGMAAPNDPTAFSFDVKLTAPVEQGDWSKLAVENGTISNLDDVKAKEDKEVTLNLSVEKDNTAKIIGIPAGVTYTVKENLGANDDKYEVRYTGGTGKIDANSTAAVTVTNTREVGELEVTKTLNWDKSSVPPDPKSYKVKVTIGGVNEDVVNEVNKDTEYVEAGNYNLFFDFTDSKPNEDGSFNESKTIKITNIPVGTTYTVEEIDPGTGYTLTYTGQTVATDGKSVSGTVVKGENEAVVTNSYFDSKEIEFAFNKEWANIPVNGEKLYPDSITVQLMRKYADGKNTDGTDKVTEEVVESVVLTGNGWSHNFGMQPEYKDATTKYEYFVKEAKITYSENSGKELVNYLKDKEDIFGKEFGEVKAEDNLFIIYGKNTTANGEKEILGAFSPYGSDNKSIKNIWIPASDLGKNSFSVVKVDSETNKPLAGAVFVLKNSKGVEISATTNDLGIAEFGKLPEGEYTLVEKTAPLGYQEPAETPWIITISKTLDSVKPVVKVAEPESTDSELVGYTNTWKWKIDGNSVSTTAEDNNYLGTLTVGNTQIKGNIQLTKAVKLDNVVDDNTNKVAKQEFEFNIYKLVDGKQGEKVGDTLKVKAGESKTISNLPYGDYLIVEDESNTAIENYNFGGVNFAGATAVTEDGQVIGYKVSVTEQGQTYEVTATNQYNRYTGDLSITKTVTGDKGELDKLWDFTITLKAPANADHVKLADAYTVKVTGNDAAEATQTLTLTPVADGEGAVSGKIQLAHGQTATISGLPVGTGYEVVEDRANYDDYTTTAVDENGVIATEGAKVFFVNDRSEERIPSTKSLTVYKEWALDQSEDRPESISVQLLKDGEPEGEPVVLNNANRWRHTWENLNTKDHSWSVREVEVPEGYQVTVSDVDVTPTGNEITITNTLLKPGDLLVNKVWVGDTAADRPEFITVQLYNGSTLYDTVEVRPDASGNWNYKWSDLPEGEWRVEEVDTSANYSVEYTGPVNQVATITNTYHQPLTVNKVWVGGNEANRPAAITVQLYNGTTPYGDAVQLTAEGGWTHTWTMLPLDGNWRVVETTVPDGYHANVSEVVNGVIVVTNTYDDNNGGGDEPGGDEPETNIPNEPTPLTDLPDDDVPLATLPSADGEGENDDEEIFDEEIPLADVPTTGDDGKSGLWLALAMSSGLAGIWLHQYGRKRREETED